MNASAQYPPHPASQIIPAMTEDEFQRLADDIEANGLIHPIVLHEGMVLDGNHRYRACMEKGIPAVFTNWTGQGSPEVYVVSANLHRRHLNESQRAMIAAKLANISRGEVGRGHERTDRQISRPEAAALLNVSDHSVGDAKVVQREGTPEEVAAVESGKAPVSTTAKAIRKRQRQTERREPRNTNGGASRLKVPEGMTVEDIARKALALRAQGKTLHEAAKALGSTDSNISKLCDIVSLADRTDLPSADQEASQAALALLNDGHSIADAWGLVESIADRLWGGKKMNRDRAEAKRLDNFWHAYGVITQACSQANKIDIPVLPRDRLDDIDFDLGEAVKAVSTLRKRIKELHR